MKVQLPDLSGRHVVITGANTGIGRVTAVELARAGAHVVLAGRSRERTQAVLDEIGSERAVFVGLDLGSLDDVRRAASDILALDRPIHVLINNAGLAGAHGQTRDGFELAFGTNHVGHYLLTRLLLDRICASAPARIVTVASRAHYRARSLSGFREPTASRTGLPEYQVSKLANVLFSAELARRLQGTGVTTYSLHPGVVATDIWRGLPRPIEWLAKQLMVSPEQGAQTTLHCAAAVEAAEQTGLYYDRCRPKTPSRPARDEAIASRFWEESAKWVGLPAAI